MVFGSVLLVLASLGSGLGPERLPRRRGPHRVADGDARPQPAQQRRLRNDEWKRSRLLEPGTGWGVDQLVKHSGTFSYRATGNFATATQTVPLKKGVYKLSGWIRTQGVGSGTTNGVRLQFDLPPGRQRLEDDRRHLRHPGLDAVRAAEPRRHPGRHGDDQARELQQHGGHRLVRRRASSRSSRARPSRSSCSIRTSAACSSTTSRRR